MDNLDNIEKIKEIDQSGMLTVVAETPQMLLDAYELSSKVSLPRMRKINQIVVSGMGGSAIAGDIVSSLVSSKAVYVNRDYKLPAWVGNTTMVAKETLFFALSYSGDTEETLSAIKEAAQRGLKIICITSGGKLKEIAESSGYPLYLIPSGYQPRAALPYLLVPLLKSLEEIGIISGIKDGVDESATLLRKLTEEYGIAKPLRSNLVKQLAKKLLWKIPIIFGTSTTQAAGLRLKTQFSENSKVTALFNVFPELNHNEIVNLSVLKRGEHNFSALFLRDERDSERIKKRIEITKSLIGSQLGGVNEIWSNGKSSLARILSLIYFGDFLSVYLAILRGIDPTPVQVITRLKKELMR